MDREEARRERDRAANPDPHDVPGFNRATGVDDPVPDAELEADRPPGDAPDHEHDAYAHERAATMASVASELLSAVARSDVVTDVETGRLLAGKSTTHELVADHQQAAHWVREEARRDR